VGVGGCAADALSSQRCVAQRGGALRACEEHLVLHAGVHAAGLLFAVGTATCALAGAALLTLYLGAIAINLARGRRSIDCGCLGPVGSSGHGLSWWLAPRNLALIAPAFILAASEPGSRTLGVLDGAAIAAAVATGLALYVGADQLVANQSLIRNLVR
jgi:hypothetical protein